MGSVIAYSNAVKTKLLGVDERTLDEWGAVSEQTVREMVKGALQVFKTDYAIAVSGIAGPDGGTKDKPVGTIWVAVGNQFFTYAKKLQLGKDRNRNVELTSSIALNMLRLFVLGKYDF
jgi:nicotinamide-nucleotide amidase